MLYLKSESPWLELLSPGPAWASQDWAKQNILTTAIYSSNIYLTGNYNKIEISNIRLDLGYHIQLNFRTYDLPKREKISAYEMLRSARSS